MGVTVESLSPGDGKSFPKKGDTVSMHYVGTLLDGSKFDSSRDRGSPFVTQIGVGRVIKGWDEGVPQLSLGQKANLICTPDYGGLRLTHSVPLTVVADFSLSLRRPRLPAGHPPNSTLKFEVELLKIN
ncbi:FK506 binding protein proline rotamase rapamycin-binding protein [Saitozyma podzolica]|uniref:peptidylprolyl isomerase n=1 Tax=Saitozyma podzolica TaxID=1890683 RepID=A0A427YJH4_9TREE|nr:FK506 binding protein proline rotamase rapamycin-binding protein [Saitozyma podzolica]